MGRLPPIQEEAVAAAAAAAGGGRKSSSSSSRMLNGSSSSGGGIGSGRRRRSGGIGSCSGVDDAIVQAFFRDPDEGEEEEEKDQAFKGCSSGSALATLAHLIGCWRPIAAAASSDGAPKKKIQWERRKVAALVELSRQQQAALVDKQDTIDMLEWQLQQLQSAAAAAAAAAAVDEEEPELLRAEDAAAAASTALTPAPLTPSTSRPPAGDAALVTLFEMAVVRARLCVRHFCNVFLRQMEASGYAVCRALAAAQPGASFVRKEHAAYVVDAKLARAFFHCFESESFDETGVTAQPDPIQRCAAKLAEYRRLKPLDAASAVDAASGAAFHPAFLAFCQSRTALMWAEFGFSVAFRSGAERDAFTAAFLDVAKSAWLLHRLAFAVCPAVAIIRLVKGSPITPAYVDPVAHVDPHCPKCSSSSSSSSGSSSSGGVEFMVFPGFRAQDKVIKCQVYPHVRCK